MGRVTEWRPYCQIYKLCKVATWRGAFVLARDRPTSGTRICGTWNTHNVGWDIWKIWGFLWDFWASRAHKTPTQFVGVLEQLWVKTRNVWTKTHLIGTIHVKISNFASKALFLWLRFIIALMRCALPYVTNKYVKNKKSEHVNLWDFLIIGGKMWE